MTIQNKIYSDFGKFFVRFPQGSLQDLLIFLEAPTRIKEKMSDPSIREAIFLASPVLDREIQKYLDGRISSEKETNRIKNSFIKYYTRFCSRCTPFGTFATCSYGEIKGQTSRIIKYGIKRHIQFDTFFLSELVRFISSNPEMHKQMLYYANSSIYTIGDKFRYIECKSMGPIYFHHITSVAKNRYLREILEKAGNGIKYREIVDILTKRNIDINDAVEYVNNLISSQLLQGELELSLKESDILDQIYKFLHEKDINHPDLQAVKTFIAKAKKTFELVSVENDPSKIVNYYKGIMKEASLLPIPYNEKLIVKVDSEIKKPYSAIIDEGTIQELKEVVSFCCRISSLRPDGRLNNFSNAFYERYEGQEIPLLEVLDPDIGIGYPPKHGLADTQRLLSFLNLPNKHIDNKYATIDIHLLKQLLDAERHGRKEIFLDQKECNNSSDTRNFPDVVLCKFNLMKGQATNLIVEPQFSTSATTAIGRFGYINKDTENFIKEVAIKEQKYKKNAVYAEIKHIPSTHMGNINNTTHIWDYEILFLTGSIISNECKLPVSDLMLSYKNGGLVLRSKKLNKQIIPILSNAHNYRYNTQPIYQFLADIQYQHKSSGFCFNWGELQNIFDFFPRVRYKNCILSLSTWILRKYEVTEICKNGNVEIIRKQHNIPRYVYLVDGEKTLLVDFDSENSLKAFISIIKNKQEIILKETLFDIREQTDFPVINECFVPLYKEVEKEK